MYDDDIHMNMPVEVTLECENKVLEYNDTEERPFMLPMKQPSYHYNIKRKDRLRRGRKKNEFVQRTFFLFQQSNPDHFPTKKERIMLTNQGLGKCLNKRVCFCKNVLIYRKKRSYEYKS